MPVKETVTHFPIRQAADLQVFQSNKQWLVRDIWARGGIGVIGGAPKCYKSFLALDLAVSVASGTPCLDHFKVDVAGPALVYFAEDAQAIVHNRLEALCRHRKIDLSKLDLHFITASSVRIDLKADQQGLIEAIEKIKPRLLLLDPLVRLHRLCENDAGEMSGLLGFLRDLQRRYELAIALVHHSSKRYHSQPGLGLRGSGDLYAVGDSNAYLARRKGGKLLLTLEHRAAASTKPLSLCLTSSPYLKILNDGENEDEEPSTLYEAVTELLDNCEKPMTRAAIRSELKVNNKRLGDVLEVLEKQSIVVRGRKGWQRRKEVQSRLKF